jgi:UDP-glucose 4-epimerase
VTILVTGGNGFVMSNTVRHWLESDPAERVVILDVAPPDAIARRFFAAVAGRVGWVEASILDRARWAPLLADRGITRIVHGATLTPHPYVASDGTPRDPEREGPQRIMDVNLMGTIELLEWARGLPALQRFLYVSTGSVYRDDGPADRGQPLPEDGYVGPTTLYGISKYASEMVVRRYSELFGLSVVSVRLASVYGPMDRETSSRHVRCMPWRVAHLALAGEELRANAYDGVGDWIHAGDVAEAIARLLLAPALRHPVYNVASGRAETIGNLLAITGEKLPMKARQCAKAEANLIGDPDRLHGQWGAYDISRLSDELGWQPAPLRRRMHEYIDWLCDFEPEAVKPGLLSNAAGAR